MPSKGEKVTRAAPKEWVKKEEKPKALKVLKRKRKV